MSIPIYTMFTTHYAMQEMPSNYALTRVVMLVTLSLCLSVTCLAIRYETKKHTEIISPREWLLHLILPILGLTYFLYLFIKCVVKNKWSNND